MTGIKQPSRQVAASRRESAAHKELVRLMEKLSLTVNYWVSCTFKTYCHA